jgi:predicted nucleotidyltransferase
MKKQPKNTTAMSCEDIISILKKELPRLRDEYGVQRIALYGSFAKGNPKKTSDVDILVDIRRPIGLKFVALAVMLEDKLGRKVDIATLSHYKQSFGNPRYKHIAENIRKSMIYV